MALPALVFSFCFIRSTFVAPFGSGPRFAGSRCSPCFCLPVATNPSILRCSMSSTIGSKLLFIVSCFRYRLPDDQQQSRFHRRLRIVTLHNPVGAFHDARLRIGEVILILVLWLGLC